MPVARGIAVEVVAERAVAPARRQGDRAGCRSRADRNGSAQDRLGHEYASDGGEF